MRWTEHSMMKTLEGVCLNLVATFPRSLSEVNSGSARWSKAKLRAGLQLSKRRTIEMERKADIPYHPFREPRVLARRRTRRRRHPI